MRATWSLLLLVLFAVGCGPKDENKIRSVRILSPLSGEVLGTSDDLNGDGEGLAINATVAVFVDDGSGGEVASEDGITVRLKTNQLNQQSAQTVNGQASFDSFLLIASAAQPNTLNSLQACVTLEDGSAEICSEVVVVQTDIVGPPCNIVVPTNNEVLDEQDDADQNLQNGFQVGEVVVSTDAGDGTQVLLRVNNTQAGSSVVQGSVARFVQVKLETGDNALEASCLDQAGNTGIGTSSATVDVTLPSISITAPAPGDVISSTFSPASFTVTTSTINVEPGQPVFLSIDGNAPLGPLQTDANGQTVFSVQLSEGNHTLQAQTQDLAGTNAESLVVDIVVDIIDLPPTVTMLLPSCVGGNLQLFAGDDLDSNLNNGIQAQLLTSSTGTDVDLEITSAAGGSFTDTIAVASGLAQFPNATFQIGANTLELTPRDTNTNLTGTTFTCNVTVVDADFLSFIEPTAGDVIGISSDLDGNIANGLQIRARVSGTSGIPNNTDISILVDGVQARTKAMNNGFVNFDGADAIPITVEGSVDLTAQGPGTVTPATISITVDIQPPAQVSNLACDLISARDGAAVCTFTAPQDPAPATGVERYEVRALENQVIDATTFAQASIVASPTFNGGTEVLNISGLRPGPTFHIALVAIDQAGNRSLVSNDAIVKVNGVEGPIAFSSAPVLSPAAPGAFGSFGSAIDAAGDLNGDGIDDLIVSAPFAGFGEVYIYYGSAQNPATTFATPSATIVGSDGFAGFTIAGIGDFDGDSLSDFAIGDPFANGFLGSVYIFRGRSGGQAITGTRNILTADLVINNNPADAGSNFGIPVSAAGDVDGDGRADLLIGANNAQGNGAVYLVYGQDLSTPQVLNFPAGIGQEFRGQTSDSFASALSVIGDINNDSFADIAIGAAQLDFLSGNDTGPGYVAIFLGGARPAVPPVGAQSLTRNDAFAVLTGLTNGIDFGLTLAGLGPIDGDNRASLLVGDRTINNSQGQVYIFDDITAGTTNASSALQVSRANANLLGTSAAISAPLAGRPPFDIDNDGFSDMLVSELTPGVVYLFYGDNALFTNATLDASTDASAVIVPTSVGSASIVQFIGDINADGFVDFVVSDASANDGDGAFEIFF
jgi:hypothetical protein